MASIKKFLYAIFIAYSARTLLDAEKMDTSASKVSESIPSQQHLTQDACNAYAWPTIILIIFGVIVVIYILVAPNVDQNRRIFGFLLMGLWTAMWSLILWALWRGCHEEATWLLLLVPVTVMTLFFVLIIIMNAGSLPS